MAVTPDTIRVADQLRVTLGWQVSTTERDLVVAWARVWEVVAREWEKAAAAYEAAAADGTAPSPRQVLRMEQTRAALAVSKAALTALAEETGGRATATASEVIAAADSWQAGMWATQLPPGAGGAAAATWTAPSNEALAAIVQRTTEQITAVTRPLAAEATEAMKREVVRAVAVGANPRDAALRMVTAAEGGFNGGRTRALTIARTEILDAHRAGSLASDQANAGVLRGWVWLAELGRRTCPSCWAMHGTEHPIDEPGPLDHQRGRCARAPLSKSWKDLGFDIDEPDPAIPDARAAFSALSPADQVAVMGPGRLAALQSGRLTWDQIPVRRSTDGWRDSIVPRPLSATPTRTGGAA